MSLTLDVSDLFPVSLIASGLSRLWMVDVESSKLVPNVDVRGVHPCCPITLSPPENPVLLGDGFVYEEAAICTWLAEHSNAPCTNTALQSRQVLRLKPLRDAIEQFLSASTNQRSFDLVDFEQIVLQARKPSLAFCLDQLEVWIQHNENRINTLTEQLAHARSMKDKWVFDLVEQQGMAAQRIQTATRAWRARQRLFRLAGFVRNLTTTRRRRTYSIAKVWIRHFLDVRKRQANSAKTVQRWWRHVQISSHVQTVDSCSWRCAVLTTSGKFSEELSNIVRSQPHSMSSYINLPALEDESAWFHQERQRRRRGMCSDETQVQCIRSSDDSNDSDRMGTLSAFTISGSFGNDAFCVNGDWFEKRTACNGKPSYENDRGCLVVWVGRPRQVGWAVLNVLGSPVYSNELDSRIPPENGWITRSRSVYGDIALRYRMSDCRKEHVEFNVSSDSDSADEERWLQAERRRRLHWMQSASGRMDAG